MSGDNSPVTPVSVAPQSLKPEKAVKASASGGVIPMSIEGRCRRVRERLMKMSEEDRRWRAQWLKDQVLAHDEPRYIPEYYRELQNPIRRFYKWPLDKIFEKLQPVMGAQAAGNCRWITGKVLMAVGFVYLSTYYLKYHSNDWTRCRGCSVLVSRRAVLPGEEGYPATSDRKHPWDYHNHGFKERKVFLGGLY